MLQKLKFLLTYIVKPKSEFSEISERRLNYNDEKVEISIKFNRCHLKLLHCPKVSTHPNPIMFNSHCYKEHVLISYKMSKLCFTMILMTFFARIITGDSVLA